MSQFFVFDAATTLGIPDVTVAVTKDSDGSSAFSGTTDASGKVDFTIPSDTPHTARIFKPGEYDGVAISVQVKSGVLYPASVSLVKVANRQLKLKVSTGVKGNWLAGAMTQVFNASNALVDGGGTDAAGGKWYTLPANLTGWKVVITSPGVDGVSFPLEKIDLLGEISVVLNPVIS
jgi:hypothetical protein